MADCILFLLTKIYLSNVIYQVISKWREGVYALSCAQCSLQNCLQLLNFLLIKSISSNDLSNYQLFKDAYFTALPFNLQFAELIQYYSRLNLIMKREDRKS